MFLVSIDSLFFTVVQFLVADLYIIFFFISVFYSIRSVVRSFICTFFFFFSLVSLWQHISCSSLSLLLRIGLCQFYYFDVCVRLDLCACISTCMSLSPSFPVCLFRFVSFRIGSNSFNLLLFFFFVSFTFWVFCWIKIYFGRCYYCADSVCLPFYFSPHPTIIISVFCLNSSEYVCVCEYVNRLNCVVCVCVYSCDTS